MVVPPVTARPRPACTTEDVELFYGPEGEVAAARLGREEAAKRVCLGCPIREACLDGALARREQHGVWGGMTTPERKNLLYRAAAQG